MTSYDVIGDIHGQAEKLEALLTKLGYTPAGRGYKAPAGRQAVFLGDLIDRGPGQLRVLAIVRAMVESGDALCIAGNHEFNAVGYASVDPDDEGQHLRVRGNKNRKQHGAFLEAVKEDSPAHLDWVNWFRTLPMSLDLGGIRVVHADWSDAHVETVNSVLWNADKSRWSDEFLYGAYVESSELMRARKQLTCGLEHNLPEGQYIAGKAGHRHKDVRIARWRHGARRLKDVILVPHGLDHHIIDVDLAGLIDLEPISGSPVFIGHHWFSGHPVIESPKLACLDWSAAADGPLVAYRWDGESELSNDKLLWAGGNPP